MQTGKLIKDYRRKKGITQKELSVVLGLNTAQFMSNIERDLAPLPAKYFKKVSKTIGVPVSKIVDAQINDFKAKLNKQIKAS